jgi:hypothetical protein
MVYDPQQNRVDQVLSSFSTQLADGCLWALAPQSSLRGNARLSIVRFGRTLGTAALGHNRTQRLLIQSGHPPATAGLTRSFIDAVKPPKA